VRNWDLDHPKLVTLLVANKRVQFNKKGEMQVSRAGARNVHSVATKVSKMGGDAPTVLRGEGPLSVRDRLARLRQLARAQYVARKS
jgi:hypothetical protein